MSIGLIYLVFGFLKFLPNFSPAEDLAVQTIELMTFGLFSGSLALYSLAFIETVIGLGLLLNIQPVWMIRIALWHMLCTFFPMILLPQATYTQMPYSLSIVGQYIIKNVVVIAALLALYINCDPAQK
jgi:hypothetical protein